MKINRKRGLEIRGQGAVGHKFPCLATCTYYCRVCSDAVCFGYATPVQSQETRFKEKSHILWREH